jgi:hypothetical protein
MKGIRWALGALTLSAALMPGAANAQYAPGYDGRYGNDGQYGIRQGNTYSIGYSRGFRDGNSHGVRDARKREGFNYDHDRNYRRGDSGYRGHYGPRYEYVAGYRAGYANGYRSGYRIRGSRYGYGYDDNRGSGYDNQYDRRYDDDNGYQNNYGNRHHHRGVDGWCYKDHDNWDDVIFEIPRR